VLVALEVAVHLPPLRRLRSPTLCPARAGRWRTALSSTLRSATPSRRARSSTIGRPLASIDTFQHPPGISASPRLIPLQVHQQTQKSVLSNSCCGCKCACLR
jgi:hypothetical protein